MGEFSLRGLLAFLILLTASIQIFFGWRHSEFLPSRDILRSRTNPSDASWKTEQKIQHGILDLQTKQKMQNAGLNVTSLDTRTIISVPTWSKIEYFIGSNPNVVGLETCKEFQSIVGEGLRYIGVSGMFNSGTNVLAYLLEKNCYLPGEGRPLWQVPWGKHSIAARRDIHTVSGLEYLNKTLVLPAIMVRNPYHVLESLCRNSYSVNYPEDVNSTCPHMVHPETGELLPVEVGMKQPGTKYPSVVHFWNRWYEEYVNEFQHPRLFVRTEDLTVHPKETIRSICDCAGGTMTDEFSVLLESAKKGMGHGEASEANGLVEAWARLGREVSFPEPDYEAIKTHLDTELMRLFGYRTPQRKDV